MPERHMHCDPYLPKAMQLSTEQLLTVPLVCVPRLLSGALNPVRS